MKTKRRLEAWVLRDAEDGHIAWSFDPPTVKAAQYWSRRQRSCVRLVELRRGDVVLSREDVAGALQLLDDALYGDGDFGRAERDLRGLLRGGR